MNGRESGGEDRALRYPRIIKEKGRERETYPSTTTAILLSERKLNFAYLNHFPSTKIRFFQSLTCWKYKHTFTLRT